MPITYTMQVENNLLVVHASGEDKSLEDTQAYGQAVLTRALAENCCRVLCDERNLRYRLSTIDTFALAATLAEVAPHIARVAIVCTPACFSDARFWENVAVNRGLSVCAFKDLDRARAWLAE